MTGVTDESWTEDRVLASVLVSDPQLDVRPQKVVWDGMDAGGRGQGVLIIISLLVHKTTTQHIIYLNSGCVVG